jgi:uncharacterized protein involved in type VI secretion and phage assembly
MSTDVFSIQCDALDGAKLVGFKATEVLSRPFEVELFFTAPVGTDVRSAIGGRATLTADRDDGRGPMCWHGLLASIRLLHETGERALYRAALVPKLWFLRQHVRSFVHTKKKVDAFAADTLKTAASPAMTSSSTRTPGRTRSKSSCASTGRATSTSCTAGSSARASTTTSSIRRARARRSG